MTRYESKKGVLIEGDAVKLLKENAIPSLKGSVNLLMTSPPFPLNNKKKYGNQKGVDYLEWFAKLSPLFSELLAEDGSLVIEIGNSWEPNRPVQSLLHLQSLLAMVNHPDANLRLIQEFICYNPSRLPSPAPYVTVERIRTVDSYTHVWWIAKTDNPKANNRKVLRPYSKGMQQLLKRQSYNAGKRPSEHVISQKGFLKDHGGSIAHNVIELEPIDENREVRLPHNVLSFSNTNSNDHFLSQCRALKIQPHPARMSKGLINFFIEFLTEKGDLVLDPFSGSNTTGYCAELLERDWFSFEIDKNYIQQAILRFSDPKLSSPLNLKENGKNSR
jgi:DNA modification methylase